MSFENIPLNDGRKIPSIAFGTGSSWYGRAARDAVIQALYAGFTHIDTAQAYGNEESVGAALRETGLKNGDVWITTKYRGVGGRQIRYALEQSLVKLGLKYVDLYLIHSPERLWDIPETWKQFEQVLQDGLAKSIGVSNFYVKDLEKLLARAKITPAVNQISFSPYKLREMLPVIEYCKEHGIVVEAYSSLAPITKQPHGPVDEPVRRAAERLKATPGQVLLAWVKQKGCVIVTTSSKRERLREYLDVARLPPLTEEEIRAIDEAGLEGAPLQDGWIGSLRTSIEPGPIAVLALLLVVCLVAVVLVAEAKFGCGIWAK